MIEGFIDCIPPTATSQGKGIARSRTGRTFCYRKPKQQAAHTMLSLLLRPHRPRQPLTGPLSLALKIVHPWLKSESKTTIAKGIPIPKDTKPDADNMSKGIQDVMSDLGFWQDDSQVCDLHVQKFWGARPGIEFSIKPFVT